MDHRSCIHDHPFILGPEYFECSGDLVCHPDRATLLRRCGSQTHYHVSRCDRNRAIHGRSDGVHSQLPPLLCPRSRRRFSCEAAFHDTKQVPSALGGCLAVRLCWVHHLLCLHRVRHCRSFRILRFDVRVRLYSNSVQCYFVQRSHRGDAGIPPAYYCAGFLARRVRVVPVFLSHKSRL